MKRRRDRTARAPDRSRASARSPEEQPARTSRRWPADDSPRERSSSPVTEPFHSSSECRESARDADGESGSFSFRGSLNIFYQASGTVPTDRRAAWRRDLDRTRRSDSGRHRHRSNWIGGPLTLRAALPTIVSESMVFHHTNCVEMLVAGGSAWWHRAGGQPFGAGRQSDSGLHPQSRPEARRTAAHRTGTRRTITGLADSRP